MPYSSLVSADVPLGVLVDGSPGFLLPSRTLLEALLGNPMAPLGTSLVLQGTPLDVSLDAPLSTPLVVLLDAPLDFPMVAPLAVLLASLLTVPLDVPLGAPLGAPLGISLGTPLDVPLRSQPNTPLGASLGAPLAVPLATLYSLAPLLDSLLGIRPGALLCTSLRVSSGSDLLGAALFLSQSASVGEIWSLV